MKEWVTVKNATGKYKMHKGTLDYLVSNFGTKYFKDGLFRASEIIQNRAFYNVIKKENFTLNRGGIKFISIKAASKRMNLDLLTIRNMIAKGNLYSIFPFSEYCRFRMISEESVLTYYKGKKRYEYKPLIKNKRIFVSKFETNLIRKNKKNKIRLENINTAMSNFILNFLNQDEYKKTATSKQITFKTKKSKLLFIKGYGLFEYYKSKTLYSFWYEKDFLKKWGFQ